MMKKGGKRVKKKRWEQGGKWWRIFIKGYVTVEAERAKMF